MSGINTGWNYGLLFYWTLSMHVKTISSTIAAQPNYIEIF